MTLETKLIIFGLLIVATVLEVSGDAIIRVGLGQRVAAVKGAYILAGAAILFGYGLSLNLAPIEFHWVVGVYIATLFVVWQVISFLIPVGADCPHRGWRVADRDRRTGRHFLGF